jgi:hypothetical protein
MRRSLTLAALFSTVVALSLWPGAAHAVPPVANIDVRVGDVTFTRIYDIYVLAIADPEVASAEFLANKSGEVLITGKAVGETDLVALVANGRIIGVHVVVRAAGQAPVSHEQAQTTALEEAKKACPKLKIEGEGEKTMLTTVAGGGVACLKALSALFSLNGLTVKQTDIEFDGDMLMAQLGAMQNALVAAHADSVKIHYQGATLMLEGHVSSAEAERAILAIYRNAVGGIPVDDELEVDPPPPPPDAGPGDDSLSEIKIETVYRATPAASKPDAGAAPTSTTTPKSSSSPKSTPTPTKRSTMP